MEIPLYLLWMKNSPLLLKRLLFRCRSFEIFSLVANSTMLSRLELHAIEIIDQDESSFCVYVWFISTIFNFVTHY